MKSGKGKEISQRVAKVNVVERPESLIRRIDLGSRVGKGERGRTKALNEVVRDERSGRERGFSMKCRGAHSQFLAKCYRAP